ncbi:MAG: hypothetical protein KAI73_02060 [Rhodospirillaceae bacterium]|nr:hypothetical protein [Rhodospirillaceae bacterium]
MALGARQLPSLSQPLPVGQSHAAARAYATVSSGPVEEIDAKSGVTTEENFAFKDFTDAGFRRRREAPPIKNTAGKVDIPSASFAHIMIQEQANSETPEAPQYGTNAFRGMLSRAINAYENTAEVISGGVSPLGATFSLTL